MTQKLDGYPGSITIEKLLASGRWSANVATHWKRVGKVRLNGEPLMRLPFRMRTPSPNERRYSKKWSEVLSVARVFAFYNEEANLTLSERPDIRALSQRDGHLGIEVVDVTDSAGNSAIIDQLQAALEDDLIATNTPVSFVYRFWYERETPPRTADVDKLVAEMICVIKSRREFHGDVANASEFPFLAKFKFRLHTNTGDWVEIGDSGGGYAPSTLTQIAQRRLDQKRVLANDYDAAFPLWLVMHLNDRQGIYYESIQEFAEAHPDFQPFKRVHLMYREMLITLDDRFGKGWTRLMIKSGPRRRI